MRCLGSQGGFVPENCEDPNGLYKPDDENWFFANRLETRGGAPPLPCSAAYLVQSAGTESPIRHRLAAGMTNTIGLFGYSFARHCVGQRGFVVS